MSICILDGKNRTHSCLNDQNICHDGNLTIVIFKVNYAKEIKKEIIGRSLIQIVVCGWVGARIVTLTCFKLNSYIIIPFLKSLYK